MKIRFALLAEGSSDAPLVPHLENLCLRAGAAVVSGYWIDFRKVPDPPARRLTDQLTWVKQNTSYNLLFIHRDADNSSDEHTRTTIDKGVRVSGTRTPHVPVVPIQELEAWLLLDEHTLRTVPGNPNGKAPLSLPKPRHVERRARPKEALQTALKAAEKPGRRTQPFGHARRLLLERLDLDGPVNDLRAWQNLLRDINTALEQLRLTTPSS